MSSIAKYSSWKRRWEAKTQMKESPFTQKRNHFRIGSRAKAIVNVPRKRARSSKGWDCRICYHFSPKKCHSLILREWAGGDQGETSRKHFMKENKSLDLDSEKGCSQLCRRHSFSQQLVGRRGEHHRGTRPTPFKSFIWISHSVTFKSRSLSIHTEKWLTWIWQAKVGLTFQTVRLLNQQQQASKPQRQQQNQQQPPPAAAAAANCANRSFNQKLFWHSLSTLFIMLPTTMTTRTKMKRMKRRGIKNNIHNIHKTRRMIDTLTRIHSTDRNWRAVGNQLCWTNSDLLWPPAFTTLLEKLGRKWWSAKIAGRKRSIARKELIPN